MNGHIAQHLSNSVLCRFELEDLHTSSESGWRLTKRILRALALPQSGLVSSHHHSLEQADQKFVGYRILLPLSLLYSSFSYPFD